MNGVDHRCRAFPRSAANSYGLADANLKFEPFHASTSVAEYLPLSMDSLVAERFANLTSPLGVLEVRCESECIVIFVQRDATDEDVDAIRLLAVAQWGRPVLVGRRSSITESGVRPAVRIGDAPPSRKTRG